MVVDQGIPKGRGEAKISKGGWTYTRYSRVADEEILGIYIGNFETYTR